MTNKIEKLKRAGEPISTEILEEQKIIANKQSPIKDNPKEYPIGENALAYDFKCNDEGCKVVVIDNAKKIGLRAHGNDRSSANEDISHRSVKEIYYGNTVLSIDKDSFYDNPNLKKVDGPSIECILANAFYKCTALTSVNFPNVLSVYGSAFHSSKINSSIVLNKLQMLGINAFYSSKITGFASTSLTSIPDSCFYNCLSLDFCNCPTVTEIGHSAFAKSKISNIDLNNVRTIKNAAFLECKSLNSDIICNSLMTLGSEAFHSSDITGFSSNTLTEIYGGAFSGTKLTHFDAPLLKTIKKGTNNSSYYGNAFDGITTIQHFKFDKLEKIEYGSCTFNSCGNLQTVDFANNSLIINCADSMFYGCSNLRQIYFPIKCSITGCNTSIFYKTKNITDIYFGHSTEWENESLADAPLFDTELNFVYSLKTYNPNCQIHVSRFQINRYRSSTLFAGLNFVCEGTPYEKPKYSLRRVPNRTYIVTEGDGDVYINTVEPVDETSNVSVTVGAIGGADYLKDPE